MSSVGEGEIVWYRDRKTELDPEAFERLLTLLGTTGDGDGHWTLVASKWQDVRESFPELAHIRNSDADVAGQVNDIRSLPVPPGAVVLNVKGPEWRLKRTCHFDSIPRDRMLAMADPRVLLYLVPGRASLDLRVGMRLGEQITNTIDADIAGTFRPGGFVLMIGSHPLLDPCNDGNPVYAGESFFDVSLFGHGYPLQPEKYREVLATIPEVIEFQQKLSDILGPVKLFARWEPP